MLDRILGALARVPERLAEWAGNLSAPALGAIGVLLMAGVGAGGFYAYRTYDYVQHDNNFCMSCHLMQEPFNLFAKSAHQGLGCKACHQPTIITRSQMALTQIIENPEEISAHAEVPNERCAHCHIDGDPKKWRLIANSAGHKVHLESKDPKLQGLQCVECHSTSVHEFAPIDRTCAQSGCHEDKKIMLAGMSNLTVHCAACHNFLAPVNKVEQRGGSSASSVDRAILPDREECLSCHAMRSMVKMPNPDPHGGVCASCHNPHVQKVPAEAVQSCAKTGCHTQAATLSPMHKGLQPGVLENCISCHKAHDFKVEAVRCLDCHGDLDRDSISARARPGSGASSPHASGEASGPTHLPDTFSLGVTGARLSPAGFGVGWWAHAEDATATSRAQEAPRAQEAAPAQERPKFTHARHQRVDCRNCHDTREGHGRLLIATLDDCRACHHRSPATNDCTRCHTPADPPTGPRVEVRPMNLSVGVPDPERRMTFPHARHSGLPCGKCHTQGSALSAVNVDCDGCHQEHHQGNTDCSSCHRAPPASAHPPETVHLTCSGAGCHQPPPFASAPRSRTACVVCHQDRKDHRSGRVCPECHKLPDPRGAGREASP